MEVASSRGAGIDHRTSGVAISFNTISTYISPADVGFSWVIAFRNCNGFTLFYLKGFFPLVLGNQQVSPSSDNLVPEEDSYK